LRAVQENQRHVIRNQFERSTSDFSSHVAVYAITRDRQSRLAIYPVTRGTSRIAYIARCLDAITATGLTIQAPCLDREFYARKVIAFLITGNVPFTIPISTHSRAMKKRFNGTQPQLGYTIIPGNTPLAVEIEIAVTYGKENQGCMVSRSSGMSSTASTGTPG
jgi:hypothetical protein